MVELGFSDDLWVHNNFFFVNDLCFCIGLCALKISTSVVEMGSCDDFWVDSDSVFVNDF